DPLERRQQSLGAEDPGSPDYIERMVFERLKGTLEEGTPIRAVELDEDSQTVVRNYQLLSAKPMVVAFNVNEDNAASPDQTLVKRASELAAKATPAFSVCATIEEEIAQLEPADQPEFLKS